MQQKGVGLGYAGTWGGVFDLTSINARLSSAPVQMSACGTNVTATFKTWKTPMWIHN